MATCCITVRYADLPVQLTVENDRLVAIDVAEVRTVSAASAGVAARWSVWFESAMAPNGANDSDQLNWQGIPVVYQQILWELRKSVTVGATVSYGELAARVGKPRAARVVGRAMALNPFPILFPCHRVLLKSGAIGNYSAGGATVKRRLLEFEKAGLAH